jgi:hypothetical protein
MIADLGYAGYLVAAVAVLFAGRCYKELHSWARQCQGARIMIAYNNRVKLQAPLTEWLLWTRKLGEDERSTGRVIYRANKVSVAIAAPAPKPPRQPLSRLLEARGMVREARGKRAASGAPVQ